MTPQGWTQSVLALRVPSFNPSAKTCVQGTVTGACPSKLQVVLITSFIMTLKKEILSLQHFSISAVCTTLLVAVCQLILLSTEIAFHELIVKQKVQYFADPCILSYRWLIGW